MHNNIYNFLSKILQTSFPQNWQVAQQEKKIGKYDTKRIQELNKISEPKLKKKKQGSESRKEKTF